MGRSSTKQLAKRRMARIYTHIDAAINLLAAEYTLFEDSHPELAKYLEMWAKGLLLIQSQIVQFWERCWGSFPEDISSWV